MSGIGLAALLLLGSSTPYKVIASDHVQWVKQYQGDPGPEGIAVDKPGNIYVSFNSLGQVHKITPDGSAWVLIDFGLPPLVLPWGPLGLAVDAPGDLYVALSSGLPATHGVYRVDPDGVGERLPGSENIGFPNSLAFDEWGNLYVTNSFGAVWRVPRGGTAELWIQHSLLAPTAFITIGANGVAYRHGAVFVANTARAHIVRIPVEPDGSAGAPEVIAQNLGLLDGIALDVRGSIYALDIMGKKLVRVNPHDGSVTTLATASDGLDLPASLAFGTGKGYRQCVFVTNFAPAPWGGQNPGILSVEVDVPGLPLP